MKIDIDKVIDLVNQGLSIRQIAKEVNSSYSNIKYWINKTGLKTKFSEKSSTHLGSKLCPRCDVEKDVSEFYKRRVGGASLTYCKCCVKELAIIRQRNHKARCVEYLGGKCSSCGYCKSQSALEFHHKDPLQKEFMISSASLTTFDTRTKVELDKCILLCANCHREEHDRTSK